MCLLQVAGKDRGGRGVLCGRQSVQLIKNGLDPHFVSIKMILGGRFVGLVLDTGIARSALRVVIDRDG